MTQIAHIFPERFDQLLAELSEPTNLCGTAAFHDRLLSALARYLRAETYGVMQYSRHSIPHYFIHDTVPEWEIELYLSGTYRFDPFFRHWRENGQAGLLSYSTLGQSSRQVRDNLDEYTLRFQPQTGMVDEIAFLFPKIGGSVDNYFFLRGDPFHSKELEALNTLFPMLNALSKLNRNLMLKALKDGVSTETDFPSTDTFIIESVNRRIIYASPGWHDLVGGDVTLSDAVAQARDNPPSTPIDLGHGHILSEALEADFPLAPGGRITFFVGRPLASPSLVIEDVLQQLFADTLTAREFSICDLVLRGHPSTSISEKLGISLGTVKNHRKRIYRKLDITTERELFLLLINFISTQDAC
ncbi:helix-turn-helix transcriptional regulator [Ruegeria sp.]|uniref:helix-turn-helix transcriptional regulator n=1 Tax=Ruegeria sp. TaxID=1879320 RepID=UPI00231FAFCF|nr:helix-turn-helix transcriptional regulator [Ruegeria sp.]MDA7966420.1 helix-turn-helix transcriptional regulator [Ruegeria sp.]